MAEDGTTDARFVSTGRLPQRDDVRAVVRAAFERHRGVSSGEVADYIPALAETPADLFGVAVASVDGTVFALGDSTYAFSIQSVSKPFVFALVAAHLGPSAAAERLGTNSTGLGFDSVIVVELNTGRPTNPMVNPGAIATTSLVPGATAAERWDSIVRGLSAFAGRPLALDEHVYRSEAATNGRNRGVAHLLESYGRLATDAEEACDLYTRQCSLLVTTEDLAVMGATLADGGVNPLTREQVIPESIVGPVLAVMATAGLYEHTGRWLYEIGLPGKSGVSGGIVTVAPGKGGLGVFSPRLDEAGNSVRGQLLTAELSHRLGLSLFDSQPFTD